MGKIFEALKKTGKEGKISSLKCTAPDLTVAARSIRHDVPVQKETPIYGKQRVDDNLVLLLRPQSFESEQFKLLRTNILFPASGKPPRSIMVTSAVPGEGKTFVAANLSVSISQNINEHVLLIDCDMRRPGIHSCFGFPVSLGLTDYLTEGTPLDSLLLRPDISKLTILPAGKPPHNPSELLSSTRMSKLLEEVKERYSDRYIIIDSPPPQITPEASAIARQVDGILLVIRCGDTPRGLIENMIELIGKDKILGVVFNRVDLQSSRYCGYGKYSKYYKQYQ